ncbi:MAG: DUF2165 family protein [Pseudomonadota bacterium]
MFEILFDAFITALPGLWLAFGVHDNLRHPDNNREAVMRVLAMEGLGDYPEVGARVGHRRITDPRIVRRLFAVIVAGELLATMLMLLGAALLLGATLGLFAAAPAYLIAEAGLLAFAAVWGGMLIGGQYFYYWYGDHGQSTHLLALLWGLVSVALLRL